MRLMNICDRRLLHLEWSSAAWRCACACFCCFVLFYHLFINFSQLGQIPSINELPDQEVTEVNSGVKAEVSCGSHDLMLGPGSPMMADDDEDDVNDDDNEDDNDDDLQMTGGHMMNNENSQGYLGEQDGHHSVFEGHDDLIGHHGDGGLSDVDLLTNYQVVEGQDRLRGQGHSSSKVQIDIHSTATSLFTSNTNNSSTYTAATLPKGAELRKILPKPEPYFSQPFSQSLSTPLSTGPYLQTISQHSLSSAQPLLQTTPHTFPQSFVQTIHPHPPTHRPQQQPSQPQPSYLYVTLPKTEATDQHTTPALSTSTSATTSIPAAATTATTSALNYTTFMMSEPTTTGSHITDRMRESSTGQGCVDEEERELWKQYLRSRIQVAEQELILKKEDVLLKQAKRKYYEKKLQDSNFTL